MQVTQMKMHSILTTMRVYDGLLDHSYFTSIYQLYPYTCKNLNKAACIDRLITNHFLPFSFKVILLKKFMIKCIISHNILAFIVFRRC